MMRSLLTTEAYQPSISAAGTGHREGPTSSWHSCSVISIKWWSQGNRLKGRRILIVGGKKKSFVAENLAYHFSSLLCMAYAVATDNDGRFWCLFAHPLYMGGERISSLHRCAFWVSLHFLDFLVDFNEVAGTRPLIVAWLALEAISFIVFRLMPRVNGGIPISLAFFDTSTTDWTDDINRGDSAFLNISVITTVGCLLLGFFLRILVGIKRQRV